MMASRGFPGEWFPSPYVYLCGSDEEGEEVIKGLGLKEWDRYPAPAYTVMFEPEEDGDRPVSVVIMDAERTGDSDQTVALMAHEAVHVAQQWCEIMGEKDPGDETFAYMVQSVMLSLLEQV